MLPATGPETAVRRRAGAAPSFRGVVRDKSDYHLRKTASEYNRKVGIKWC